jgi:hypothetical protein
MRNWLIFSILSISINVKAQDAVMLEAGQKAPFTGILMVPSLAQDLRKAVIERDSLVVQKESYERSLALTKTITEANEKKISILLEQNDKLALRLGEERSMGNWERLGWLSIGIIATGIAAYGIKAQTSN